MAFWIRKNKPVIVRARYVDLHRDFGEIDPSNMSDGYPFIWPFPQPAVTGMRVWIPGIDGIKGGVIVGFGNNNYHDPVPVQAIATPEQLHQAAVYRQWEIQQAAAEENAWLDIARKAAGLQAMTRRRKVPDGFPAIAPIDGQATPKQAGEYGRMWWRAYKRSEELGRDPEEAKKFRSIAHRWYAIRDRSGS